jgi:hypothetical protein
MMKYAHIINSKIELSAEEKSKFGILKGSQDDSYAQVSVVEKSEMGVTCMDTFIILFNSKITEDELKELIKLRANEVVQESNSRSKSINSESLIDLKIHL